MTHKNLGKLTKADLRSIWTNEEKDFSSWLAEPANILLLGEELGIEMSLVEKEAGVGRYSVDILAEEEGTGKKIVIENQLENTNHDHLGKIITYAAGHDASMVIWIFKDIREEHRQAVDWLNEHTEESISFFAVKVEAWQIDNSAPAPKFHIISRPNEWAKTVRTSAGSNELGKAALKQLNFWSNLKSYANEKGVGIFSQTPSAQHWYNISIGSAEAHISLTVHTRDDLLGCEIYINDNKELYKFLFGKKDVIENKLSSKLEWIDAKKASRILQRKTHSDLDNVEALDSYYDWFIERASSFQKVFARLVKEYKNAK